MEAAEHSMLYLGGNSYIWGVLFMWDNYHLGKQRTTAIFLVSKNEYNLFYRLAATSTHPSLFLHKNKSVATDLSTIATE